MLAEPERKVDFIIENGIVANADADLMRVLLENLISNAWKYTSKREKADIEFGVTDIDGVITYSSGTTVRVLTGRMRENSFCPSSASQARRNSEGSVSV